MFTLLPVLFYSQFLIEIFLAKQFKDDHLQPYQLGLWANPLEY